MLPDEKMPNFYQFSLVFFEKLYHIVCIYGFYTSYHKHSIQPRKIRGKDIDHCFSRTSNPSANAEMLLFEQIYEHS